MTTPFRELAGSPVETFTADGMKARRRLVTAWEDRHALVAELLGQGYTLGAQGAASYPGRPMITAAEVRLEPWPAQAENQGAFTDVALQLNRYDGRFALVTVDYTLAEASAARDDLPSTEPDTFLTYRMDFGAEYEPWPAPALRWNSAVGVPVPPDAAPSVRVPIAEHHVTWHRVARPPWEAIRACIGAVNAATFLGAASETLLLDGATAEKQFLGADEAQQPRFGWRISYVFREKAVVAGGNVYGWNHRFRHLPRDNPGWDRLLDLSGGSLYRSVDFTPLFFFAAEP